MRALETYEALAERAAHYGLVDIEIRALIGTAYPLSWVSSERCLEALERALRLGAAQGDPLLRARTRASCLVRRIWVRGWNSRDAEECRDALAEIRQAADRLVLAPHLVDYSFIQWISSEYGEAYGSASEGLAILLERPGENSYLSIPDWVSQIILPWTLLFLGKWGEALAEIRAGISMADKNGDHYRGQTLRLYQAWVLLNAMDFAGVVRICESVLPLVEDPGRGPWRRLGLILAGSAETALRKYESAHRYLSTAMEEMDRQRLIFDWYSRMLLESALSELWLAKGDLVRARPEADQFLSATLTTAERTWRALAWEASARVGIAQRDFDCAHDCVAKALSTIEGFELPLAEWRLHATAFELCQAGENSEAAEHHRQLSRATILKLADSLAAEEPLRQTFLSAPSVRKVIGNAETPNTTLSKPVVCDKLRA
jgi:tetratricopeptide (TPR) repeat protein